MQNNRSWNSHFTRLRSLCALICLMLGHQTPMRAQSSGTSILDKNGKTYVVIIAVENYKTLVGVKFANNDARGFLDKLQKKFGFYPVEKFHSGGKSGQMLLFTTDNNVENLKPTSTNILTTFTELNGILKPEDTLIIYWAGHGQEFQGKPYLLTMDADLSTEPFRERTTITIPDLEKSLKTVKIHRLLGFIDACRSDPRPNSGDKPNPLAQKFVEEIATYATELVQPRGVGTDSKKQQVDKGVFAILWAYKPKQSAWPDENAHHGSFTNYLLRALDELPQEKLTMENIETYVHGNVKDWSVKRAKLAGENGFFEDLQEPWLQYGSGKIRHDEVPTRRVALKISVNVEGATILVDGQEVKNGRYEVDIKKSQAKTQVTVVVQKEGYKSKTEIVTIDSDTQDLSVNLEPIPTVAATFLSGMKPLVGRPRTGIAKVGGKEYRNSLSYMHGTRLGSVTYLIDREYDSFEATVGFDDAYHGRSFDATFTVYDITNGEGAGRERNLGTISVHEGETKQIKVSVKGVRKLKLSSTGAAYVPAGSLWWGEARLK